MTKLLIALLALCGIMIIVPNASHGAASDVSVLKVDNIKLIPVPKLRQATDYTCGVCALQAVLAYYGYDLREDELSSALKADPRDGTRYMAMADYSKKQGFTVDIYKDSTLEKLLQVLKGGQPAIVLVQAWAENKSGKTDYADDWDDGHYVVAVGYDSERIYFMDPSTTGTYTYIKRDDFLRRWHDTDGKERLRNFFMVVSKAAPAFDPDALTELK